MHIATAWFNCLLSVSFRLICHITILTQELKLVQSTEVLFVKQRWKGYRKIWNARLVIKTVNCYAEFLSDLGSGHACIRLMWIWWTIWLCHDGCRILGLSYICHFWIQVLLKEDQSILDVTERQIKGHLKVRYLLKAGRFPLNLQILVLSAYNSFILKTEMVV